MVELSELHELTELTEPSDLMAPRERNQGIAFYTENELNELAEVS